MEDNEYIGREGILRREDVIRVLAEALNSLGLVEARTRLEQESGIPLQSSEVNSFVNLILQGNWDDSIAMLHNIGQVDETQIDSASFLIFEQKFKELLREGRGKEAFDIVSGDFSGHRASVERVRKLMILMARPADQIQVDSREELLEKLNDLLCPAIIPKNRMLNLMEEAVVLQASACRLHNSSLSPLLLSPHHQCDDDKKALDIPSRTLQTLREHKDEVLVVRFSHNGRYLASSSGDRVVIIWEVQADEQVAMLYKLEGGQHNTPVYCIEWSPDDTQFLTCGNEEVVNRWETVSGQCLCVYQLQGLGLISCTWASDGNHIFTGVSDKRVIMWNLQGVQVNSWESMTTNTSRVLEVNDTNLISVYEDRKIGFYALESESLGRTIYEKKIILTFSLSNNNEFLLVSVNDGRIHLWDIAGRNPMLRGEYHCLESLHNNLSCCCGGVRNAFIASAMDCEVYIWHRFSGENVLILADHTLPVNSVSWNPCVYDMLASGSDDQTIRIWRKPER